MTPRARSRTWRALRRFVLVGYYLLVAIVFLAMAVTTVVLVAAAFLTPDREISGDYWAAAIVTFLIAVLGFVVLAVPPSRPRLTPGTMVTAMHHHPDGTASFMLEIDSGAPMETTRNRAPTGLLVWQFRCLADDHTIVTVSLAPKRG